MIWELCADKLCKSVVKVDYGDDCNILNDNFIQNINYVVNYVASYVDPVFGRGSRCNIVIK